MRDFEVVDLVDKKYRFNVIIKFQDNDETESYCFAKGQGWDVVEDGVPAWLVKVKKKVADKHDKSYEDIDRARDDYVGYRISYAAGEGKVLRK